MNPIDDDDARTDDSTYASDYDSGLESVNSRNYRFAERGNRRVHGMDNGYYMPSDDLESRRLNAMQFAVRTLYDGCNIIPSMISRTPSMIIDVGTGPGRWAIEVAEQYPSARVVGIDLAPTQPDVIPSNCQFVIGDAIVELPEFHDCNIDLVNSRFIVMGLRKDQWPTYYDEVFRIIKHGGYVQTCEIDHFECRESEPGSIIASFFDYLNRYHEKNEWFNFRDGVVAQYLPMMEAAGFVDVQIHRRSFDHGNWRQGESPARAAASQVCPDAFPGYAFSYVAENLFGEYIPDPEERKVFAAKVQESFDGTGNATFHMAYLVGRKPELTAEAPKAD